MAPSSRAEEVAGPAPSAPAEQGSPSLAVLDTNVWLDWLVFGDPTIDAIARSVQAGRLQVVACPEMRDELAHVLGREPFCERVAREHVLDQFDRLSLTKVACSGASPLRCTDPDDQVFLDLAVAAKARWLFSRDKALLALARRARQLHALQIIAPAQLARMQASAV
jgi:uncharacterized protein